ncbi:MAG: cyanoexosortase A system-associated protein [Cyanobacteria bacterium J06555_13]
MASPSINKIKHVVLVLVFGAVALVLGKVTLLPAPEKRQALSVSLPDDIPLEGWKNKSTKPLDARRARQKGYTEGKQYQYAKEPAVLDIQARYFVGTNGNVKGFINTHLSELTEDAVLEGQWEVRELEASGAVLLLSDRSTLHLSSCINPYGKSTVSARAFKHNRNFQDIRYRIVPWLLGENLKDDRCLWTHMSIAKEGKTDEETSSLIEEAWADWHKWWSIRLFKM